MSGRLAAVPDTPPRAVLYLRQSVSRDDSVSLELQETAARDHCARHGYAVTAVEADPGISGRTWDRPAVQRVMGMVEQGSVDVVVVWRWSRLSRSRRDWAVAVDRIEAMGGQLESATEPVDVSTASGRFARGMLAELAAFESDRIGEVWREVHARRIAHGLPSRGGDRFGYRRLPDGGYEPDPTTGPLLAEAYRRVADGHSLRSVTAWLDSCGATTLAGQPWTRDRLTRVLDSGFGAGLLVRQGRRPGGGVDRRLEALTWAPALHPPLVDRDTWDGYLLARRGRRHARPPDRGTYVLSGLLRCECGAAMWADRLGRHAGYAFVCSAWKQGMPGARCVSIARTRAETAVLTWLAGYAADVEAAATRAARAVAQAAARDADAAGLAREITRLEQRQTRLLAGWLDGLVPGAAYTTERDRITAAADLARARLDGLERERRRPRVTAQEASGLLEEWDELPVEHRRLMLSRLIDHVEVRAPQLRGRRAGVEVIPRASE